MAKGFPVTQPRSNASGGHAASPEYASLRLEVAALMPSLRRYARVLKRDPNEAEDLVQECLCRMLAKLHLWRVGTNLRTWAFTILHNQHVSDVRRIARRGMLVELDDDAPIPSNHPGPFLLLQLRDVERALAELPESQREAILCVCVENRGYEKAAALLRIPVGTVRSRLARAREDLRTKLQFDRCDAIHGGSRESLHLPAPSGPG
jgi:RNA polymerase sigma-70 factor, ECF subfamily